MISTRILLHSINPDGDEIVTWLLKYPRFIHSELMTHRVFSRNASSSRAIPIERIIKAVEDEPAMFEFWGKNQKGMQAVVQLKGEELTTAKNWWLSGAKQAVTLAREGASLGLHKQIVNRALEPWTHMTTLVTCTNHHGFFRLRAHKDAQPEFMVLAFRMLDRYLKSEPTILPWGEWHIPFGDKMNLPEFPQKGETVGDPEVALRLKVATARAARTSYLTFDGAPDINKDVDIHNHLSASGHWSPFEHCAYAEGKKVGRDQGNFKGWTQYRKMFSAENITLTREEMEKINQIKPDWFIPEE